MINNLPMAHYTCFNSVFLILIIPIAMTQLLELRHKKVELLRELEDYKEKQQNLPSKKINQLQNDYT